MASRDQMVASQDQTIAGLRIACTQAEHAKAQADIWMDLARQTLEARDATIDQLKASYAQLRAEVDRLRPEPQSKAGPAPAPTGAPQSQQAYANFEREAARWDGASIARESVVLSSQSQSAAVGDALHCACHAAVIALQHISC